MMRAATLMGFLIFAVIGCSSGPALDQAARRSVAAEAAALLDATPANEGLGTSIPQSQWPKTIRSLDPQDVSAKAIGLYVSMGAVFTQEWGYFIPRNEAAFSPMAGGDPSYRGLGDGVYWYVIKG
jgi:hypothetical protein